ncbi:MAG: hypothetical protein CMF49_03125 [Legionellales bacterium]|nr:hypothetical protein [Legionellales bacterium]
MKKVNSKSSGKNTRFLIYPNQKTENGYNYYIFTAYRLDSQDFDYEPNIKFNELFENMPCLPEKIKQAILSTPKENIIKSRTLRQLSPQKITDGLIALLGDSAHAMAPTAGLGVILGIINSLYLATYIADSSNTFCEALKKYEEETKLHFNAFLRYTSELTDNFYADNHISKAQGAMDLFASLDVLVNVTTNKVITKFNNSIN